MLAEVRLASSYEEERHASLGGWVGAAVLRESAVGALRLTRPSPVQPTGQFQENQTWADLGDPQQQTRSSLCRCLSAGRCVSTTGWMLGELRLELAELELRMSRVSQRREREGDSPGRALKGRAWTGVSAGEGTNGGARAATCVDRVETLDTRVELS